MTKELNIYSDESGQTNKAPFVSASIVSTGEINFFGKGPTRRNFGEVKEKLRQIDGRYSKYVSIVKDTNFFEEVQRKCEKMHWDYKKDVPAANYVWMHCRSHIIAQCLAKIAFEDFEKVNVVLHQKSLTKGGKDLFECLVKNAAIDLMIKIIDQSSGDGFIRDGYLYRFKYEYTKRVKESQDKILFIWTKDEKHGGVALAHYLAGYYKVGLEDHSFIAGLEEVGVECLDLSKDVSNWNIPI